MNQNELRIGNLLHYKLFADNISVRGIGKNCIWLNDNEHAGPISIEHLESIPLTEEWLEKLGLTKSALGNDFEPNEQETIHTLKVTVRQHPVYTPTLKENSPQQPVKAHTLKVTILYHLVHTHTLKDKLLKQ